MTDARDIRRKLTDFTPLELEIADALGVREKLPVDKSLFDGGCLCHTYPKNSDSSCGNHAKMLGDIRNVEALIESALEAERKRLIAKLPKEKEVPKLHIPDPGDIVVGNPTEWMENHGYNQALREVRAILQGGEG
jgi:hypothetical protein